MDYNSTPTPVPAPEERAAFHLGLWSLLSNLLCGCFPVSILLGILALVRHGRAKARAAAEPERYAPPAPTGLVLGLIGMAWTIFAIAYIGVISAIAIPGLLGQRARAKDKVAVENMVGRFADLVAQFDKLQEAGTTRPEIPGKLESYLRSTTGTEHNPWNPAGPAFDYRIEVMNADAPEEAVERFAKSRATVPGRPVYVMELFPDGSHAYLAGAVRIRRPVDGETVVTKSTQLE